MLTVLQRLEASAYRNGRLVCTRVAVTVVADAPSARRVRVRFVEAVEQQLHSDLQRLTARRGAFATRMAERLDPVEIAGWDADAGREWRLVGRLERPTAQYWPPTDAEFWLRETTEPITVPRSRQANDPTDERPRPASLLHGRR